MRNLKRALSLALASVMLMGMMVVGSSAAGYTDVDSADNVEAIEVLQAVGVMTGDTNGNFNPDQKVTRNEMAVVMANLLKLSVNDFTGAGNPFTDVVDWARRYVSACYADGIISGTSATTFGGEETVTAVQAGLMILKALGYFQYGPDFGDDWQVATIRQASKINLFDGIDVASTAALTRNQVAQMVLNALKADMVEAEGTQGTNITLPDGSSFVTGYAMKYDPIAISTEGSANYAGMGGAGENTRQLCEQLYGGDLKVISNDDGMSRPGKRWTYKSEVIGTYADAADTTVVVSKSGKTVATWVTDELKRNNWTFAATPVSVNGGAGAATSTPLNVGDIVEFYMSDTTANQVDKVCITRYSVDEVTGAVATKGSAANDDLEIRIPGFIGYTDADKVNGNYNALAKDDIVYYYEDNNGVVTFAKADFFEGAMTGTKTGTTTKYVIDGADYIANGGVGAITGVTTGTVYNTSYNYYTDNNGYLIAAKENENAQSKDYVVIQDIQFAAGTGGITGSQKVEARLVKMDGTVQVVEVEAIQNGANATNKYVGIDATTDRDNDATGTNGSNKWLVYDESTASGTTTPKVHATVLALVDKAFFTYSVNSDGEYTLTKVLADPADNRTVNTLTGAAVGNGKASITGTGSPTSVAVNNSTVFVVATETGGKKFTTYTGMSAVADIAGATVAYVARNGVATYVYVDSYSSSTISGDSVYIMSTTKDGFTSERKADNTTIYYNTYKAIVDGQSTTVKVRASDTGADNITGSVAVALFTPTYDDDGLIIGLAAKSEDDAVVSGYRLSGGTLITNTLSGTNTAYSYNDNALVFIMDSDGNVTEARAADIDEDKNDSIYVVKTNTTDSIVDYLFIVEVDDSDTSLSALSGDNSLPTLNTSAAEQTVAGAASTAYTITATPNGVGAVVEFSATGTSGWAVANGSTNKVTTNAADGAAVSIWVRVTSVDDSVRIYKITITSPVSP